MRPARVVDPGIVPRRMSDLQLGASARLYGLRIDSCTDEEVRATVAVRDEIKQPLGLVHGGVFAAIAESIASFGTWKGVHRDGRTAQGLSNQTSFLRPILTGT